MQFSWPVFAVVLGLGIVQVAVGVILGRCLPNRGAAPAGGVRLQSGKLRLFARRLDELVSSVADDVGQHQTQIRQVNRELSLAQPEDAPGLTEVVLSTVAQIVQINERLQNRLSVA